jgi:3-oxoacyl-[acyl-carrier protein] reductase
MIMNGGILKEHTTSLDIYCKFVKNVVYHINTIAMITYNFDGQTVIVTGGGQGIGRITALKFAKAGANVAIFSRTFYDDLEKEMKPFGEKMKFYAIDVSQAESVNESVNDVINSFGKVDVLVNNASISKDGLIEDISDQDWDMVMNINVKSYFLTIKAVISGMKTNQYGKIVNVSSVAGRDKSMLLGASYSTSKAAILGLTRQVAAECGKSGINVNSICPSQTYTPMLKGIFVNNPDLEEIVKNRNPLGYIADPEQMANVIMFLASDESNYMNGAIVDINGGLW